MVFCDKCNICVHQACYGITAIPSGILFKLIISKGVHYDIINLNLKVNGFAALVPWALNQNVYCVQIKMEP